MPPSFRSLPLFQCLPGTRVLLRGRPCIVEKIESLERVVVCDELSNESEAVSPVLLKLPNEGPRQTLPEINATKAELELAFKRATLLMPFATSEIPLTSSDLAKLKAKIGLGKTQIYSCIAQLRKQPCAATLVRAARGPKPGESKLDPDVEAIIAREITSAGRKPNTVQVKAICAAIDVACDDIGKRGPCEKTVRKRIDVIRHELTLRHRLGKSRAQERTRAYLGRIKTISALETVEIDHSPLDIILVSSQDRVPIGRAFLTLVIDTHTRVALGFHLSLDAPQILSVALAITHAVMPKEAWLAEHDLSDLSWPMYGLMRRLRLDRAPEFRSPGFILDCRHWGIDVEFRRRKEDGAIVERAIGMIQARASQEPGATGSDPKKRRRERDAAADAQMTMWEAERWVARELAMRYHYRRHEGIGMSPRQAWLDAHMASGELVLPTIVSDEKRFLTSFLPRHGRVINHDGVRLFGERYFSRELVPLVRPGVKRVVRYDPRNMGRIYVDCGTGAYIAVPYVDATKPCLPLFEIKAMRAMRREAFPNEFDGAANREYTRAQQRDRNASRRATRAARRQERLLQASESGDSGRSPGLDPSPPVYRPESGGESVNFSTPATISRDGPV